MRLSMTLSKVMVVASLFLSSCGTEEDPFIPDIEIDESLTGFLDEFKSDAASYGIDLSNPTYELRVLKTVGLGVMRANTVHGTCHFQKLKKNSWAIVRILKDADFGPYSHSDPEWSLRKVRSALYHEFGHCLLGLNHDTELGSIMLPTGPTGANDAEWKEQLDHLFNSETINRLRKPDF